MRYLFLFLSIVVSCKSFAQKILFSDTSNKWVIHVPYNGGVTPWWYEHYSYAGTDSSGIYRLLTSPMGDSTWIREDTVAGKVYSKAVNITIHQSDTAEMVLYDYSLQEGDTIRVKRDSSTEFEHILSDIDTILINNLPHKVFHFISVGGFGGKNYQVIEGLGAKEGPLFPYIPFTFEESRFLYCFTHWGSTPFVDPAPFVVGTYVYNMGMQDYQFITYPFHNTNTCQILSVKDIVGQTLQIFPQPAGSNVTIKFPQMIQHGSLVLFNTLGQQVCRFDLEQKNEVVVTAPPVPGVYFFQLYEGATGRKYNGKVVFE